VEAPSLRRLGPHRERRPRSFIASDMRNRARACEERRWPGGLPWHASLGPQDVTDYGRRDVPCRPSHLSAGGHPEYLRSDDTRPPLIEGMESSTDSNKAYLIVWLSGMVVGVVLIERWRGMEGSLLAAANVGEAIEAKTATTVMQVSAGRANVSTLIVTGAKADVERARHLLTRATPWTVVEQLSTVPRRHRGQRELAEGVSG
jgi:hypothetical protein